MTSQPSTRTATYGYDAPAGLFSGKEREGTEAASLDFFQARYMSAYQQRFSSPDPANAGADLTNPQSWNAYSYVWDSPLTLVDPTGMAVCFVDGFATDCNVAHHMDNIGTAAQCPNNQCTLYDPQHGFLHFQSYADGLSGYVGSGAVPYQTTVKALGQTETYYHNILTTAADAWHWLDDNLGITGPSKFWRNICASGGFQAGDDTCYSAASSPLRIIHLEPPLQSSASYKEWSLKSTQEIIDSLAPGATNPLMVTRDGAIMNGNTRITILSERGIDVNTLPRVVYTPHPLPELGLPPTE